MNLSKTIIFLFLTIFSFNLLASGELKSLKVQVKELSCHCCAEAIKSELQKISQLDTKAINFDLKNKTISLKLTNPLLATEKEAFLTDLKQKIIHSNKKTKFNILKIEENV